MDFSLHPAIKLYSPDRMATGKYREKVKPGPVHAQTGFRWPRHGALDGHPGFQLTFQFRLRIRRVPRCRGVYEQIRPARAMSAPLGYHCPSNRTRDGRRCGYGVVTQVVRAWAVEFFRKIP